MRTEPCSGRVALELVPDALNGAEPSDVFPAVKLTVPVGAVVPEAGFTVTVRTVEDAIGIVAGLAVAMVVVATNAAVAVTVRGEDREALNPVAPA